MSQAAVVPSAQGNKWAYSMVYPAGYVPAHLKEPVAGPEPAVIMPPQLHNMQQHYHVHGVFPSHVETTSVIASIAAEPNAIPAAHSVVAVQAGEQYLGADETVERKTVALGQPASAAPTQLQSVAPH